MKTTILTLATICSLVLGTVNTSKAASFDDNNTATVLTDVKNISKIEIRGNVEVYVSDGNTDQVKVYNNYYAENALIQNDNGILRIASYGKKLVVWVTAKQLHGIAAYDNAVVKSFGKLSAIALDVELHDSSAAHLNFNSYSANITVADKAIANLGGSVSEYELNYGRSTSVNYTNLVAFEIAHVAKSPDARTRNNTEMAIL